MYAEKGQMISTPSRNLRLSCLFSSDFFFFNYLSFGQHFLLLTLGPAVLLYYSQNQNPSRSIQIRSDIIKLTPLVWQALHTLSLLTLIRSLEGRSPYFFITGKKQAQKEKMSCLSSSWGERDSIRIDILIFLTLKPMFLAFLCSLCFWLP